ncbi:MAG: hypothetical protein C5B54_03400 [Acidobacteria bacterium]|nr:MAG: hypothetical protein C5B54_03400 [Acidobacteriota bacterium]
MKTLVTFAFAILLPALSYHYPHRPSVQQASSDDEMYEVFSAAIKELFLDKPCLPGKVLIIEDHTTPYFEGPDGEAEPAKRTADWANSGLTVSNRMVEDFKLKNKQSISLQPRLTLPFKQVLISERELNHYFREGDGWTGFHRRHPNSFGYVRLSRVGFNPEHDRALLYVVLSCGNLCGSGYYVLVAKNGPAWSVVYTDGLWVS